VQAAHRGAMTHGPTLLEGFTSREEAEAERSGSSPSIRSGSASYGSCGRGMPAIRQTNGIKVNANRDLAQLGETEPARFEPPTSRSPAASRWNNVEAVFHGDH
jgi:hypothetical protein